jgi:hypothetical protein
MFNCSWNKDGVNKQYSYTCIDIMIRIFWITFSTPCRNQLWKRCRNNSFHIISNFSLHLSFFAEYWKNIVIIHPQISSTNGIWPIRTESDSRPDFSSYEVKPLQRRTWQLLHNEYWRPGSNNQVTWTLLKLEEKRKTQFNFVVESCFVRFWKRPI